MALIVEDGTGRTDAESYISVTDATAYFAARGNTTWAGLASDTVREQLLRKATDYMAQMYRVRWAGSRVTTTQALDWPRAWVPFKDAPSGYGACQPYYPNNAVPLVVAHACAELAVRAASSDLAPDVGAQVKQETVGPISVTYADGARQVNAYKAVDAMLAPFFNGSGVPVFRA